jgi:hypothetical protein
MSKEHINEPQQERAAERTPEAAYEAVLRDPVIYRHYEGVFKGTLRELQLRQNDLNFPLNDQQVDLFVICLQQALDSRHCGDTEEEVAVWVERNLRLIRQAKELRKQYRAGVPV